MSKTIKVPFTKLRRIVHISDLHIRLFRRHNEYSEAFETLYAQLRATDLSETVIVFAGDLVHSKLEMSPEMISLASSFLVNLATLAPTIVIAGNHDCNLSNTNRLDSLSPIIDNISHENLHYLKHTDIYSLADVDFYVYSIFGDRVNWPAPIDNGRTRIALYHGPIFNATTDVGYTITSRHVEVETFDGFEMVLLGDIHSHQKLQEYDAQTKKPIIVYSSSLLQQSHGEKLRGHGWCDWDVATRSFQFNELPNKYGFYTLEVKDGVVPNWDDMPQNVYLRVFAGAMSQSDIKKLEATIRAKRNVKEFSASNFEGAKKTNNSVAGVLLDIFDVNVQNKLIEEYLKTAMPTLTAATIDRVIDLNIAKNGEISADDLSRKIVWRPITLTFDNLFTYGPGNSIDFTELRGVNGIFAANASGKTSIAEAICFALYDRTPRTQKAANIMNTRSTKCHCRFEFAIDDVHYVIERTGNKNKKGEVKMDVDFYRLAADGTRTSLNGEERRYTNQAIRGYVGDFEDFLLTTFSSSSQTGLFVDKGQSDRKDLLSQFMGLTIFDKLHTLANDEIKEVQGALKRFKNDDFTQELVEAQREIDDWKQKLIDSQGRLDRINGELNNLNEQIQAHYEQKTPVKTLPSLSQLEAARDRWIEQKATATQRVIDSKARHAALETQLVTAKDKLVTEFNGVEKRYKHYQELEAKAARNKIEFTNAKRQLEKETQNLTISKQFQYDPTCTFCVTNGKVNIERIALAEAAVELARRTLADNITDGSVYDGLLVEDKDIGEKYKKMQMVTDWISKATNELIQLDKTVTLDEFNVTTFDAKIEKEEASITEYHSLVETVKQNQVIDDIITELENTKRSHKTQFNMFTAEVTNATVNHQVTSKRRDDILLKIKEAKELEEKFVAYEAYLAAVCRDGLPYKLIAEILPNLEHAVNELLGQMVSFTLVFETDGKNINIRLKYDDENVWPLELASGMEKFISSLAIRVALTGVSSLSKSNFLVVDEGFGSLDADNLSSVAQLFDVLRTKFDFILVISHIDIMRDFSDKTLEIRRIGRESQIVC